MSKSRLIAAASFVALVAMSAAYNPVAATPAPQYGTGNTTNYGGAGKFTALSLDLSQTNLTAFFADITFTINYSATGYGDHGFVGTYSDPFGNGQFVDDATTNCWSYANFAGYAYSASTSGTAEYGRPAEQTSEWYEAVGVIHGNAVFWSEAMELVLPKA